MTTNMGTIDRVIRIIFAVAVGVLAWTGVLNSTLAIALGVLAAVFVVTAAIGFCPLYVPLHIKTKKTGELPKSAS